MTERKLVCVSCPVGCEIVVELSGDEVRRVEGNRCKRGETYARQETVEPMRVLATSVKVLGGDRPIASIKTDGPVPKAMIPEIMEFVRSLAVEAPVRIGQTLACDVLGSGAKLIATRAVSSRGSG